MIEIFGDQAGRIFGLVVVLTPVGSETGRAEKTLNSIEWVSFVISTLSMTERCNWSLEQEFRLEAP